MKKFYFTLLAALLFSLPMLANKVIVKGTITYSNGNAAVNQYVQIRTDSLSSPIGCYQSKTVVTNANGYYIDSFVCTSGNIVKVMIATTDCNGAYLIDNPQVNSATNIVEKNFVLSCSLSQSCAANFNFNVQQALVSFTSTSTTANNNNITSYHWSFGDGTTGSATTGVIQHSYNAAGTYSVKLFIETANGCKDSIVKAVTIAANPGTCHAQYRDSFVSPNKFYFFSGGSTASTGSTITARVWSFGDGTFNTGNNENVDHIYQQNGTYNVCLKIITSSGCMDSVCKTFTVNVPPPACHANFTYQIGANGAVYFTNTSSTLGSSAQYYWNFDYNTSSTDINPVRTLTPGVHNVCLRIFTSNCADSICQTVTITAPTPTPCEAVWAFSGVAPTSGTNGFTIQFGSSTSHASSAAGDSIRERIWSFGDGSYATGNLVYTTHTYSSAGTYNVCLIIRSVSGCSDTTCKTVTVPMPNQVTCSAQFTYENLPVTSTAYREVRFNSTTSSTVAGDSIISRKWTFGDGTTVTTANAITSHVYAQPGTYTVCLTITTALGCSKTECKTVIVTQVTSACVPHFTWVRTAPKQVSFNSTTSWVPLNDTIIERKWNFGDASSILAGNVVSPVHNYLNTGIYTVSLRIRTNHNCEQTYTVPVLVQDSIVTPPTVEPIKIISIYPNPATIQTQTVVWSQNNNVQAELAVYDVYGIKKWSITKVLLQGNNITVVPTALLMPGPYYFRVTTIYGVKSRAFFKRN